MTTLPFCSTATQERHHFLDKFQTSLLDHGKFVSRMRIASGRFYPIMAANRGGDHKLRLTAGTSCAQRCTSSREAQPAIRPCVKERSTRMEAVVEACSLTCRTQRGPDLMYTLVTTSRCISDDEMHLAATFYVIRVRTVDDSTARMQPQKVVCSCLFNLMSPFPPTFHTYSLPVR